jgi:four helix bundle protein
MLNLKLPWKEQMKNDNLKLRTKKFALDVLAFVEKLPRDRTCDVLGRQLLRSGTSVGANYRSACRAKSSADFVSKMGIVEEEADETGYWLELLADSGKIRAEVARNLLAEANELTAISVASINTARRSQANGKQFRSVSNSALRTPRSAL